MTVTVNTTIAGGSGSGSGGSPTWGSVTGTLSSQTDLVTALGGAGYPMTFSTNTTDADPGQGVIRFNNATQASTTILYVDNADINNNSLVTLWKSLGEGAVVTVRQNATKWQEFLVQGVFVAAGYVKITGVWRDGGTALDDAASIYVTTSAYTPYLGAIAGDVTAITRNADGSAATVKISGVTWTQNYNGNGALSSETSGSFTRTYNYSAAGVFTGVTGAVNPSLVQMIGLQYTASSKSDLNTTEAAVFTLTIPAGYLGTNDMLILYGAHSVPNSATTKTTRVRLGGVAGTSFMQIDLTTSLSSSWMCTIANRNSASSQVGDAPFTGGLGSSATAISTGAVNTAVAQDLVVTAQWGTAGTGTNNITLERVSVLLVRGAPNIA